MVTDGGWVRWWRHPPQTATKERPARAAVSAVLEMSYLPSKTRFLSPHSLLYMRLREHAWNGPRFWAEGGACARSLRGGEARGCIRQATCGSAEAKGNARASSGSTSTCPKCPLKQLLIRVTGDNSAACIVRNRSGPSAAVARCHTGAPPRRAARGSRGAA